VDIQSSKLDQSLTIPGSVHAGVLSLTYISIRVPSVNIRDAHPARQLGFGFEIG